MDQWTSGNMFKGEEFGTPKRGPAAASSVVSAPWEDATDEAKWSPGSAISAVTGIPYMRIERCNLWVS